jgi:hypothetical protein
MKIQKWNVKLRLSHTFILTDTHHTLRSTERFTNQTMKTPFVRLLRFVASIISTPLLISTVIITFVNAMRMRLIIVILSRVSVELIPNTYTRSFSVLLTKF